jgi:hypothetical protein
MAKVSYTSDKGEALQAHQQLNAALTALTTGWAGLDAAGKTAALRQGLILALRMIRWLINQHVG